MSIASEITRINNNIASAYSQCQSKGATMPATQNSANLANTISTISGGGGADLNDYFNRTIDFVSTSSNCYWPKMLKKIPELTISGITSLASAFYELPFTNIEIEGIDCSNITNMQSMFYGSSFMITLKMNLTNTSSITTVRQMFSGCTRLQSIIGLPSLTGTVDIRQAFYNCYELKVIDLSNWNITTSGNSTSLFSNCYKAAIIDMRNITFGTSLWTGMFTNCGRDCLQSEGAYADGIPYVYVKDAATQTNILNAVSTWSTNNVVIKSS